MGREEAVKVMRAISELGRKGGHFTTKDVRERCGWGEKDARARVVYKTIDQLKGEGILHEASSDRKRHKFWAIKEPQLQQRIDRLRPAGRNGASAMPTTLTAPTGDPPSADGLMGRLAAMDARMTDIERELRDLREQLEPVVKFITG